MLLKSDTDANGSAKPSWLYKPWLSVASLFEGKMSHYTCCSIVARKQSHHTGGDSTGYLRAAADLCVAARCMRCDTMCVGHVHADTHQS